jgi:hypothetical protein
MHVLKQITRERAQGRELVHSGKDWYGCNARVTTCDASMRVQYNASKEGTTELG